MSYLLALLEYKIMGTCVVGDVAERIEKYSHGSFVGLGGFGKCPLKVGFCHLKPWVMPETGDPRHQSSFKPKKTSAAAPPRKSEPWRTEHLRC